MDADAAAGPPQKRARREDTPCDSSWALFAECDGLFDDFVKTYLDPVSQRALLCACRRNALRIAPHLRYYPPLREEEKLLDQALTHAVQYDHVGLFRARWRRDGTDYDRLIESYSSGQCALALMEMSIEERGRALVRLGTRSRWLSWMIRPIHANVFVSLIACQQWIHFHLRVASTIDELQEHNKAVMPFVLRAFSVYLSPALSQSMNQFILDGCKDEDIPEIRGLLHVAHAREQSLLEPCEY